MESHHRHNSIPGYTGYIPHKPFMFGVTSGNANIILQSNPEDFNVSKDVQIRNYYTETQVPNYKLDLLKYSPRSSKAVNWVSGPTHELYPQFIPGYQCYVPHIKPENICGVTYAKATQKAILMDPQPSNIVTSRELYQTTSRNNYNESQYVRHYIDPEVLKLRKDEIDCLKRAKEYKNQFINSSRNILGSTSTFESPKSNSKRDNQNASNSPSFSYSELKGCDEKYGQHSISKV